MSAARAAVSSSAAETCFSDALAFRPASSFSSFEAIDCCISSSNRAVSAEVFPLSAAMFDWKNARIPINAEFQRLFMLPTLKTF